MDPADVSFPVKQGAKVIIIRQTGRRYDLYYVFKACHLFVPPPHPPLKGIRIRVILLYEVVSHNP
jgi:hypothetical protein